MKKVYWDGKKQVERDLTPEEILQRQEEEILWENGINDRELERTRQKRNELLRETDWTQLNDSPLIAGKKAEWVSYRQTLRDITDQSDIFNIVWPDKPE